MAGAGVGRCLLPPQEGFALQELGPVLVPLPEEDVWRDPSSRFANTPRAEVELDTLNIR